MSRPRPTCPRDGEHTPSPRGYLQWHEWAQKMRKTHHAVMCDGCGRWVIWRPNVMTVTEGTTDDRPS